MSAFIVNDKTITAIVTALQVKDFSSSLTDPDTGEEYNARTNPQKVGQILLNQNYRSVNYRYNEDAKPHKFQMTYKFDDKGYRDDFALGERFGCVKCYEYQACETPDYEKSEIHRVLAYLKDDIAEKMIEKLGQEMTWGL
nr:MAG TPA: hypothetical protein [Caudoviricetes sp.]